MLQKIKDILNMLVKITHAKHHALPLQLTSPCSSFIVLFLLHILYTNTECLCKHFDFNMFYTILIISSRYENGSQASYFLRY